jgi:biopolymer transport protein ExbD
MAFYQSKRSRFSFNPNTQMNITALVDVTLVTLIIYILVSPALEHGIDVQLPQATPHRMISKEPAVVSVSKKGRLFYNNVLVTREQLHDKLSGLAGTDPETSVVIRADAGIPYGDIIEILDEIRGAGLINIGLVTRNRQN